VIEAMEQGKTCTKCGEWKLFKHFYKNKIYKDGFFNQCKECFIEEKKKYYQENKERVKERNQENKERLNRYYKQYYQKNAEQLIERSKKYNQKNKEYRQKYHKQYRQENTEQLKKRKKQYYEKNKKQLNEHAKQWQQENIERIKEYRKLYYQSEKGQEAFYKGRLKRRSYKHKVVFQSHERQQILNRDNWICQSCGIKVHDRNSGDWNTPDKAHIDHIIPISKGGNSEPNNLQILCRTCNLSKHNKVEKQLSLFQAEGK
jgi:5-methylcytosine-specific restriction endonuclease McrA